MGVRERGARRQRWLDNGGNVGQRSVAEKDTHKKGASADWVRVRIFKRLLQRKRTSSRTGLPTPHKKSTTRKRQRNSHRWRKSQRAPLAPPARIFSSLIAPPITGHRPTRPHGPPSDNGIAFRIMFMNHPTYSTPIIPLHTNLPNPHSFDRSPPSARFTTHEIHSSTNLSFTPSGSCTSSWNPPCHLAAVRLGSLEEAAARH